MHNLNYKWYLYKNSPNILTLVRMFLVLPFVWIIHDIFVYEYTKNSYLVIIFIVIILSDILDGFLARKLKCTSNTGAKLDIISDAFYIIKIGKPPALPGDSKSLTFTGVLKVFKFIQNWML
jgi:phosphatidylglycerophosphate synthase